MCLSNLGSTLIVLEDKKKVIEDLYSVQKLRYV